MPKSQAFAIATQQGHAINKTPKGYGTARGRVEAKNKYKTPKDDTKMANPGHLASEKLASVHSAAFAEELSELLKQAGVMDTIKRVAMTEVPGTKPWLLGNAQTATRMSKATGALGSVAKKPMTRRLGNGVYDVSSMARQMGV